MIAYDGHGKIYVNVFLVWVIIAVVMVFSQVMVILMDRARDKRERQERRERRLCNAIVALNRHAVVVDKAIKRLKRRGK